MIYLFSLSEPSLVRHAVLNHLAFRRSHPLPYSDLIAEVRARNLGCHQRDVELSVAKAIGVSAPALVSLDKDTRSFGVSFAYYDVISAVYIRRAISRATYNRLITGFELFVPPYESMSRKSAQSPKRVNHESSFQGSSSVSKCAEPNIEAKTLKTVSPDVPESAKEHGLSGVVRVAVTLDASGAVVDAKVYKSSGSDDLDAAALTAAKASTYAAAVVNCVPRGGTYIFQSDFSSE